MRGQHLKADCFRCGHTEDSLRVKHDGFRVIARKDGEQVRLYSRPGNDFTRSFPLIVEAGFGSGIHSCFGAPLARMETQLQPRPPKRE